MIRRYSREQLEVDKYDTCIFKAQNSRIYAYSWYLDAVCDDWEVLVKDDYKVVMPLPVRKKLGIGYVYLPPWTQQLGIFSKLPPSEETIVEFINYLHRKFKFVDLQLNHSNYLDFKDINVRNNYVLHLNKEFCNIIKNYNTNRKRVSKNDFSKFHLEKDTDPDAFIVFYRAYQQSIVLPKDGMSKLFNLVYSNNEAVHIWSVEYEDEIISALLWLKDSKRITYLVPVNNKLGKKFNAATFLINQLILAHENTNLVLDFEGSMIKGVADFYKSFGAKIERYYHYKKFIFFYQLQRILVAIFPW